jgi:hypothetical protein
MIVAKQLQVLKSLEFVSDLTIERAKFSEIYGIFGLQEDRQAIAEIDRLLIVANNRLADLQAELEYSYYSDRQAVAA